MKTVKFFYLYITKWGIAAPKLSHGSKKTQLTNQLSKGITFGMDKLPVVEECIII